MPPRTRPKVEVESIMSSVPEVKYITSAVMPVTRAPTTRRTPPVDMLTRAIAAMTLPPMTRAAPPMSATPAVTAVSTTTSFERNGCASAKAESLLATQANASARPEMTGRSALPTVSMRTAALALARSNAAPAVASTLRKASSVAPVEVCIWPRMEVNASAWLPERARNWSRETPADAASGVTLPMLEESSPMVVFPAFIATNIWSETPVTWSAAMP